MLDALNNQPMGNLKSTSSAVLRFVRSHWDEFAVGFLALVFVWQVGIALRPTPAMPLVVTAVDSPVSSIEVAGSPVQVKKYESAPKKVPHIININTATQADFEQLPSIGPVKARRIIVYRNQFGDFKTVDDIINVSGIGPKTLEKFKPYLTL